MIPLEKHTAPSVRFASNDDIPSVIILWKEWCRERNTACSDSVLVGETKRIIDTGRLFLLEIDGSVVGFMGAYIQDLFWNNERVAKDQCIFVTKSIRGWAGDILVLAFENWAKMMGCSKAIVSPTLSCTTKVDGASRRLEKLGYHVHGYMMGKDLKHGR